MTVDDMNMAGHRILQTAANIGKHSRARWLLQPGGRKKIAHGVSREEARSFSGQPRNGAKECRRRYLTPRPGAKLTLRLFPTAYAVGYSLSLLRSLTGARLSNEVFTSRSLTRFVLVSRFS